MGVFRIVALQARHLSRLLTSPCPHNRPVHKSKCCLVFRGCFRKRCAGVYSGTSPVNCSRRPARSCSWVVRSCIYLGKNRVVESETGQWEALPASSANAAALLASSPHYCARLDCFRREGFLSRNRSHHTRLTWGGCWPGRILPFNACSSLCLAEPRRGLCIFQQSPFAQTEVSSSTIRTHCRLWRQRMNINSQPAQIVSFRRRLTTAATDLPTEAPHRGSSQCVSASADDHIPRGTRQS